MYYDHVNLSQPLYARERIPGFTDPFVRVPADINHPAAIPITSAHHLQTLRSMLSPRVRRPPQPDGIDVSALPTYRESLKDIGVPPGVALPGHYYHLRDLKDGWRLRPIFPATDAEVGRAAERVFDSIRNGQGIAPASWFPVRQELGAVPAYQLTDRVAGIGPPWSPRGGPPWGLMRNLARAQGRFRSDPGDGTLSTQGFVAPVKGLSGVLFGGLPGDPEYQITIPLDTRPTLHSLPGAGLGQGEVGSVVAEAARSSYKILAAGAGVIVAAYVLRTLLERKGR